MKYLLKFLLALSLYGVAFGQNVIPVEIAAEDCHVTTFGACYTPNDSALSGSYDINLIVYEGVTTSFVNVVSSGVLYVYSNSVAILDWFKASDSLYFDQIVFENGGVVKIADGKSMYADGEIFSGTLTQEQMKKIVGKKLYPISGVSLLKDADGHISATFDADDETPVLIVKPIEVTSVTYNRTFEVGKASTIMLPFSLEEGMTANGGDFAVFNGLHKNEIGRWDALMVAQSEFKITANTPYLFIPSASTLEFDLNGGTVTLVPTVASGVVKDGWTFKGVYDYKMWEAADAELGNAYGFAAAEKGDASVGDFVKVAAGAYIYPMRAYMLYNPAESPAAGEEPVLARRAGSAAKVLDAANLPDVIEVRLSVSGGETTSIGKLYTKTGEFKMDRWFSVDGRKLNAKPATKGTYFNNGQKVIVK